MSLVTTNWPSEFSELKKLESILHCPICYEYINTCMITSCSHNFCSVCIRKYLQFRNQCPTCSEETYAGDLRKNRPLDEIVTIYTDVKERLLFKLRVIDVTQSIKGCQTESFNGFSLTPKKSESDTNSDKETPKSEKPKKKVVQKLFSEKKPTEPLVVGGLTIPTIFQPRKSPKKNVALPKPETNPCPVCNVDVPVKNINFHLDSCLATADPAVKKPKPPAEKRKPLTKLVYTMMKDKELKKCLKEHGLNSTGDRKTLIWRLNRYTVLYNAECDSEHPRPVPDILKQVEREEREEKTTPLFQAPKSKVTIDKNTDPEVIEKHNKEYLEVNKDHFKALIEAMKKRDGRNIKTSKPNRIDSDEESKPDITPSVDDQVPSTSKASNIDCTVSIYSQVTVVDSDSDSDMFENSKTVSKVEPDVHQIDWTKTKVNEENTQETQVKEETVEESNKLDESIIHDEDSNSYESVFDKSGRSETSLIKTPIGKAHSLSARKKTSTPSQAANCSPSNSKMEKMVDEIFEKNDDKMSDQLDEESESEDEDEAFQFKTPVKNYDMSPEISPMKTRSKRKCAPAPSTDEKNLTRSARQKRVKRSISPCY